MKVVGILVFLLRGTSAHLRSHRKLVQATDPELKVEGEYIVVFDDGVDVAAKMASLEEKLGDGTEILYTYTDDFKGVTLSKLSYDTLWSTLLEDEEVDFVEENQVVKKFAEQQSPVWNLDRLDEQSLPLDNTYRYKYTGKGVTIFVIDTGIRTSHSEFGGRASCGFTAFSFDNCLDGDGHGTHTSSTAAGRTYGVAKDATVKTVKVLMRDGSGTTAGFLAGVEYIVSQKQQNPRTPMVANASLGGPPSRIIDRAVQNAVANGVVFVVAGGNEGTSACISSPASVREAITVGATTRLDTRSSFSNYGSCIDIFAPGEDITSAFAFSDSSTFTISGTSMAAPLVSGVAALYLEANPSWSPAQVWSQMKADALQDKISSSTIGLNSPNLLVSTVVLNGGPVPAPAPSPSQPTPPAPNCNGAFNGCYSGSDCCSGSCTFLGFCWF